MADIETDYDVIVIGGGESGCTSAYRLAPDHDVAVVDKGQSAGEASGLARSEADRIQGFFEMEYIDDTAVLADRYPGVFELDRFVGAIEVEQGGWVDPYTLTMTYKDDAEAAGAEFETGVEVTGVSTEDGAVTGVITTEGHYAADHVVVAMAWSTKEFVPEWVDLPVRPFRYQWVTLEVDRDFPDYVPVGWDIDSGLYWRPEHNDDLHVGGGTYFVDDPGSVRTTTTEGFRHHVAVHIGERVQDVVMGSPVTGAAVRSLVTGESAPFPMDNYTLERFEDWPHGWDWTFVNESPDDIGTSQSSRADH